MFRVMGLPTRRRLIVFLLFYLSTYLPLIVNYTVLRFQADPFIATSIVQAKMIEVYGSIDPGVQMHVQVSLPNWYWQGHALAYIQNYLVTPGLIIYIASVVTGLDIGIVTYLPVTYIASILLVYIVSKEVCQRLSWREFAVVLSVSTLSFIANSGLGRFYTFQYHAYSIALHLLAIYVVVKHFLVSTKPSITSPFIIVLLSVASLTTAHYKAPYELLGGLFFLTLATLITLLMARFEGVWRIRVLNEIKSYQFIIVAIITALFLRGFFSAFVGSVDISDVINNLIAYITTFYRTPVFVREELAAHVIINPWQALFAKIYTYTSLIYIALLSLAVIASHKPNVCVFNNTKILWFILGGSITVFLAYFTAYGFGNFGFSQSWLLTATISSTSLELIRSLQRRSKRLKIILMLLATTIIVSSLIVSGFTIIRRIDYNPLTPPPMGIHIMGRLLSLHTTNTSTLVIGGSISTTSKTYIDIALANIHLFKNVILANLPYYLDIQRLYNSLIEYYDLVVLTSLDLEKGIHCDITPAYLDQLTVQQLVKYLTSNNNIVLNSNVFIAFWLL